MTTAAKFKKGDRVRRIKKEPCSGVPVMIFGSEWTVREVFDSGDFLVEGLGGVFFAPNFELVEAAPPSDPFEGVSDQELADRWRKKAAESRTIREEIKRRGFKTQWRAPHRGIHDWRDHVVMDQPDELRVYKKVIPAPIETIL